MECPVIISGLPAAAGHAFQETAGQQAYSKESAKNRRRRKLCLKNSENLIHMKK